MIRNLLPQDTRLAEFASAVGLILIAMMLPTCECSAALERFHNISFWFVLLLITGALQLWALYDYPKLELLRCLVSWTNGSLWIWLTLSSLSSLDISDAATFAIGLANLYSFTINILLLRKKWET